MRISFIYILVAVTTLVACKDNFDELHDTDQRYITFEVTTEDFFDDFFNLPQAGETPDNSKYVLDLDYRIRLSCYCYDNNDSLVSKSSLLVNDVDKGFLNITHLTKDTVYRFYIFADVAKNDKALEYYESWFHLETSSIDSFYLLNLQTNGDPHHNILKLATITAVPENNIIPVKLEPISVNSYCIFTNVSDTEWISGEITYSSSFYVKSLSTRSRESHKFSHINDGQNKIIISITYPSIQDTVNIQIKRTLLNNVEEMEIPIINYDNKPFVTEIDCKSLNLTSCEFYLK